MRICILSVLHDPFDKRVFHKVAKSLVAAGHDVVSVAPSREPAPETGGVRFVQAPVAHGLPARLRAMLRLVCEGRRIPADVYLGVEPESWVAALLVKLTRGGKAVFDVHEYAPAEFAKFFPAPLRPLAQWLTLKFMRLFARFTDLIILTRSSFDELLFKGLKTPRVVVINTNHVQPVCENIPAELRERYANRPTIIHQGIFGDIRGSWRLLDALKALAPKFPELKCIVLGDYVYGDFDEYKRAVHDAGLDDVVDFIPPVRFEEVPAYIAVSKVGLILFQPGPINHTLAMPHKLFDYMREGAPVVAPDFALEVKAIMMDADCGILVDVTRPDAIAAAIERLLNDPEEGRRLGANGRRAVEGKYNWQRDEEKLLEAFARLEGRR